MPQPQDVGPLEPAQAKQLVRHVVQHESVSFSKHALKEMAKDDMHSADCLNVLRGGVYEAPELIDGTWRYRVSTRQICVVISIPDQDRVRVVTAWRFK